MRSRIGAVLAVCLIAVAAPVLAGAATPAGAPQVLAVSVPPDPVPIAHGATAEVPLRVINAGPRPVSAQITQRELELGNNGKVSIGPRPDPRWRTTAFPAAPLTIPARGYRDVQVKVTVPRRLPPDLYFVGFLVTPAVTGVGNLHVVNQIGSFFTVDVPGPRLRRLHATLTAPSFTIGGSAQGTLRITNTGHAVVRYWGENDTTSSPGGAMQTERFEPALLPEGATTVTTVTGHTSWPIGIVTMKTTITYPTRTESTTTQIVLTRKVLVISPFVFVPIALLVAGGAVLLVRRRKRRAA